MPDVYIGDKRWQSVTVSYCDTDEPERIPPDIPPLLFESGGIIEGMVTLDADLSEWYRWMPMYLEARSILAADLYDWVPMPIAYMTARYPDGQELRVPIESFDEVGDEWEITVWRHGHG
jgi:hypothetical protein